MINQLRTSLLQLEGRFKQAESMSTSISTNRQKDMKRWKALALEYEMKIRYAFPPVYLCQVDANNSKKLPRFAPYCKHTG